MSSQFDNDDNENENEIDESQESETNYQISIYASDKDIFNQIQEIKRINNSSNKIITTFKFKRIK